MVTDLDAPPGRARAGVARRRAAPPRAPAGRAPAPRTSRTTPTCRRRDPPPSRMPRLVIVIDEFASLVRELPDFVTGLVDIAQRGRSLGIHLILATQRPSGVVSPEIRANTNLRIALRVTDAAESTDVIDAPTPRGSPSPPRPGLRPARPRRRWCRSRPAGSAAARPGASGAGAPAAVRGRAGPGRRWAARRRSAGRGATVQDDDDHRPGGAGRRDPAAAAAARRAAPAQPVAAAAADERCCWPTSPAGSPAAAGAAPARCAVRRWRTCPPSRRRRPRAIDLGAFGHLLRRRCAPQRPVAAAAHDRRRDGRAATPRADVHLYGIDCGNGALLPLAALPHCGAVVPRTQTERAARLLRRLRGRGASAAGAAGRRRLRRHRPSSAPRSPAGRAAAAPRRAARPLGGLHGHARRGRRRAAHRGGAA